MKKIGTSLLLLTLVTLTLSSQHSRLEVARAFQTIPTRTSTPGAPPPTVPPPPTSKPDDNNTNPLPATATHTAVPTSTQPPSPSPVPQNVLCSENPIIQTNGLTNVRAGPGIDHEVIGQLAYLEQRQIIGRALDSAWWLIRLDEGRSGWIIDGAVIVSGNTSLVPIAAVREIDGKTSTPGVPWQPTPNPACPELPTATVAPTAIPTESPSMTPEPSATNTSQALLASATAAIEETGAGPEESAVLVTAPTPVDATTKAAPNPTIVSTGEAGATEIATPAETTRSQPSATATPLDSELPADYSSYLLAIGALLLLAGIVAALARRRTQESRQE